MAIRPGPCRPGQQLAFWQMELTDPELRPHAVGALRNGIADAVKARLLTADTDPGALAADLWAAYCGAMMT